MGFPERAFWVIPSWKRHCGQPEARAREARRYPSLALQACGSHQPEALTKEDRTVSRAGASGSYSCPRTDPRPEAPASAVQACLPGRGNPYNNKEGTFDLIHGLSREAPMTTPLQSLIATGTKVWLDSVDPDQIARNRAWGITGATSNPIYVGTADEIQSRIDRPYGH
jgi:hypothetical protein